MLCRSRAGQERVWRRMNTRIIKWRDEHGRNRSCTFVDAETVVKDGEKPELGVFLSREWAKLTEVRS